METVLALLNASLTKLASIDVEVALLALIIAAGAIILHSISRSANKTSKVTGLDATSSTVSIDGSKALPVRHYVSEMQGLAGKPDALISENGFIIPIERKPLARKLRDRYVAQLLVYMRLVEEFEGKKPPYGYLILGSNCRKIRIENSEARQAWLQSLLNQMHGILNGADALAQPHPKKCAKCDVNPTCRFAYAKKVARAENA